MGEQTEPERQQEDARPERALRRAGLRLFGVLSGCLIRLIGATWRIEVEGLDPRQARSPSAPPNPHLAALFHESFLIAAYFFRDHGYRIAVSRSRDGDLIAATLRSLGYGPPARGSSSKGGSAALLTLVRALEARTSVAVLVDGPRGPARRAKPGILTLARHARVPIQPVAFEANRTLRLGSWDRTRIPLPFARVVCSFGEPLTIDANLDESTEARVVREVEARLRASHAAAENRLGDRAPAAAG